MKLSWFFVILLVVIVAIFSVQNAEPITVRFLGWQFAMSAALVIQLSALFGALIGLVVGVMSRRRTREAQTTGSLPPGADAERGK